MATALRKPVAEHLTLAEFLAWKSGDSSGRRWQLRDGVPEAMVPATENRGAIQAELARLIGNYLISDFSACRVIVEPGIVPRARATHNVRIPNLAATRAPPTGSRHRQPGARRGNLVAIQSR